VIAGRDVLAHPAALVPECRLTAYVSNAVHHSCGTGAEEKLFKRVACNRKDGRPSIKQNKLRVRQSTEPSRPYEIQARAAPRSTSFTSSLPLSS
jgi:hypothetical protein